MLQMITCFVIIVFLGIIGYKYISVSTIPNLFFLIYFTFPLFPLFVAVATKVCFITYYSCIQPSWCFIRVGQGQSHIHMTWEGSLPRKIKQEKKEKERKGGLVRDIFCSSPGKYHINSRTGGNTVPFKLVTL